MSDEPNPGDRSSVSSAEADVSADSDVRDLLRDALGGPRAVPDLTLGVQKKIRERSGGKFYADGWSTAKHPPINTYLMTSLLMLFVLVVVYALLAPLSGVAEPGRQSPPVRVLPSTP